MRSRRLAVSAFLASCLLVGSQSFGQVGGNSIIHDPSTIIKEGSTYHVYLTGLGGQPNQGIYHKISRDLKNWTDRPPILTPAPAWVAGEVPNNDGTFWAPDVIKYGDEYRLYYSVSTFGSRESAIALATATSLSAGDWVDQGPIIDSEPFSSFNAIDPSVLFDDATGRVWMSYGSFSDGIHIMELNPTTGKPFSSSPSNTLVAKNTGSPINQIEASYLYKHDEFFYLFVNWGGCCAGVDSTYELRVGRSTSPTGPFLTRGRGGATMLGGGGEFFLGTEGDFIGPGHIAIYSENGTDYFGYHYYDGDDNGIPKYNIEELSWTMDGWPIPSSDLIPGDFNGDKVVNQADLGIWNTYYGTNADGQNFLDWQRNYGATLSTYSVLATVPEPCSVSLLLYSGVVLMTSRLSYSLR
jgi:arabinan endo-1,5-alpha-L-arabinosidase